MLGIYPASFCRSYTAKNTKYIYFLRLTPLLCGCAAFPPKNFEPAGQQLCVSPAPADRRFVQPCGEFPQNRRSELDLRMEDLRRSIGSHCKTHK
jgi:hypothetical protein